MIPSLDLAKESDKLTILPTMTKSLTGNVPIVIANTGFKTMDILRESISKVLRVKSYIKYQDKKVSIVKDEGSILKKVGGKV